ncbi:hypothetical protein AAFF_G00441140 [Aldrovandia affinis]|uniref:Uncharacterized protein n=1 Tax=Aldrovandia affinis TaxID=143900 RepID=A0AAD7S7A7_9TELE|nr:hypothetical protein AAFF_G00441140 [Aldrovandia affinis]
MCANRGLYRGGRSRPAFSERASLNGPCRLLCAGTFQPIITYTQAPLPLADLIKAGRPMLTSSKLDAPQSRIDGHRDMMSWVIASLRLIHHGLEEPRPALNKDGSIPASAPTVPFRPCHRGSQQRNKGAERHSDSPGSQRAEL